MDYTANKRNWKLVISKWTAINCNKNTFAKWWLTQRIKICSGESLRKSSNVSPSCNNRNNPGTCLKSIWLNKPICNTKIIIKKSSVNQHFSSIYKYFIRGINKFANLQSCNVEYLKCNRNRNSTAKSICYFKHDPKWDKDEEPGFVNRFLPEKTLNQGTIWKIQHLLEWSAIEDQVQDVVCPYSNHHHRY